jgi:hypothetical protein
MYSRMKSKYDGIGINGLALRDSFVKEMAARQGLDLELIKSRIRTKSAVDQRYKLVESLRVYGYSISQIAKHINRNHSSIIYFLRKKQNETKKI